MFRGHERVKCPPHFKQFQNDTPNAPHVARIRPAQPQSDLRSPVETSLHHRSRRPTLPCRAPKVDELDHREGIIQVGIRIQNDVFRFQVRVHQAALREKLHSLAQLLGNITKRFKLHVLSLHAHPFHRLVQAVPKHLEHNAEMIKEKELLVRDHHKAPPNFALPQQRQLRCLDYRVLCGLATTFHHLDCNVLARRTVPCF
mmetsp:Transcript_27782/g.65478  ORF Transcript_27782/g.65478 Transcript_27782/m.65478 type:complete len:200 (-) Transcript_27782:396-995(-)